jgi:Flp pilus assembly protein TadG
MISLAVTLTVLLLFTGIAIDSGRAYLVKAQLSKAVDGAALGAARNLNSGDPKAEAIRIFNANFPKGYLGTTSTTVTFSQSVIAGTGVNVVNVEGNAKLPTTFMKLAKFTELDVNAMGEAQRRMVDLSLVLDVSSSIGGAWPAVRDASRTFVNAFDATNDRMALVTYGNGGNVIVPMNAGRGFDKPGMKAAIPQNLPGGSTAMVQGLYRGWDELRSVAGGQQSGLRVIVLFTDGASNSVPGMYDGSGIAKGLRTYDFPKNFPDPDGQTWNNPTIAGLYHTQTGAGNPNISVQVAFWNNKTVLAGAPLLPLQSFHQQRRAGTPQSFPLQTNALKVNGVPQNIARGLRDLDVATGRYPAQVFNINNAARNLIEIISDAARSDAGGDYKIRIYTIGMGELVRYNLGTIPEKSEDILKRVANDPSSPDFNKDQLEGKYYYARTASDVGPAFQALQNQIIRLSK